MKKCSKEKGTKNRGCVLCKGQYKILYHIVI